MPPFTSETARRARQRKAGLAAARYWRGRGFANLKLARRQRSLNAARLREERMRREAEQRHTVIHPFGPAGVWYCTCGLSGAGEASVFPIHRYALDPEATYERRF